jgi:tRNA wybutosine-synthesizing protein 2
MAEAGQSTAERRPPAERVRDRLRTVAGPLLASQMPAGYQRLGRVLLVRLPESLRPYYPLVGRAWQEELGVATVLVPRGPIAGEYRVPRVERIAGTETETEVTEYGVRWRFDAASIMFAAGNRTERRRAGRVVRPGETVVDLFAGIGYFTIPAARGGAARVTAVEKNPVAADYLTDNVTRNGVRDRVTIVRGDNRTVSIAPAAADRVFLGYLPSAVPWVPRAVELLRPTGGVLHVHLLTGTREALDAAADTVERAVRATGGEVLAPAAAREVKPYGPGRSHVVVDVAARPPR